MVRSMAILSQPDGLEQQLAAMRSVLKRDVRELADETRQRVDWRYQFRAHPWLVCGGTVALGFMLVPRRERSVGVEVVVASDAIDDKKVVLRPRAAVHFEESFLNSTFRLAVKMFVTEAIGCLVRRARRNV
jgi:hypothetical protein